MAAAARPVFFTLVLLLFILYCFGIAFTQVLRETHVGSLFFPTVPKSMNTLWLYGTLLAEISMLSKALQKENIWVVLLFNLYVLTASLTIMNMLIGVLSGPL